MLDIRTLLLATSEDRYEPVLAIRLAECLAYPRIREFLDRRARPEVRVAHGKEVLA